MINWRVDKHFVPSNGFVWLTMLPLRKGAWRGEVVCGNTPLQRVLIITLGLIRLTVGNTQPIAPPQTGYTLAVATLHWCRVRLVGRGGEREGLTTNCLGRKMICKERVREWRANCAATWANEQYKTQYTMQYHIYYAILSIVWPTNSHGSSCNYISIIFGTASSQWSSCQRFD